MYKASYKINKKVWEYNKNKPNNIKFKQKDLEGIQ